MVKKSTETFEKSIEQLEQIIQQIETDNLDLDTALNHYKQGMELVKFCQEKLRSVEQKVKILDSETNQLKDFNTI